MQTTRRDVFTAKNLTGKLIPFLRRTFFIFMSAVLILSAMPALAANLPERPAVSQTTSDTPKSAGNQAEIDLIARVVYAEAKGEPFEGKVAVAAVILNRVQHPEFPDTVRGVIFEPRAFCVVANNAIESKASCAAVRATISALNGADPTNGALFFFNPRNATCRWIRTRERVAVIGQHVFAK